MPASSTSTFWHDFGFVLGALAAGLGANAAGSELGSQPGKRPARQRNPLSVGTGTGHADDPLTLTSACAELWGYRGGREWLASH